MYTLFEPPGFRRMLKKYLRKNPRLKEKVKQVYKDLRNPTKHKQLKLHKIGQPNKWAVAINYSDRISFQIEKECIILYKIGSHNNVYKKS
jgi:mRNA-degrading endonuclease YafQ of YafQ-DinJ toxin-antitoxin module